MRPRANAARKVWRRGDDKNSMTLYRSAGRKWYVIERTIYVTCPLDSCRSQTGFDILESWEVEYVENVDPVTRTRTKSPFARCQNCHEIFDYTAPATNVPSEYRKPLKPRRIAAAAFALLVVALLLLMVNTLVFQIYVWLVVILSVLIGAALLWDRYGHWQ